jgi:hypothetical protein
LINHTINRLFLRNQHLNRCVSQPFKIIRLIDVRSKPNPLTQYQGYNPRPASPSAAYLGTSTAAQLVSSTVTPVVTSSSYTTGTRPLSPTAYGTRPLSPSAYTGYSYTATGPAATTTTTVT